MRAPVLVICSAVISSGWACGGTERGPTPAATDATVQVLREAKLAEVLPGGDLSFEASGVTVVGGGLRIVFDDMTRVASLGSDLVRGTLSAGEGKSSQYEAITSSSTGRLFVSIEGSPGRIVELDAAGAVKESAAVDLAFANPNKGIEGLAWLGEDGTDRLLALSEDDGALHVLERGAAGWTTKAALARPVGAAFADFSDVAVLPRPDGAWDLVLLSQESSALWIGQLTRGPWQVVGPGTRLGMPVAGDGTARYCSLEGVAFLEAKTLVLVSDKVEKGAEACRGTSESVHVVQLP